ncbi:MAG: DNA alkylation repair protein [Candidatus Levybacteria bacterium]|nr:DNA alkylation repair protein [Candidatus Levybacteria bacterium]
MDVVCKLRKELEKIKDPARAKILQRFFKTGKGEYGEGDIFLGITVPQSRKIAKKYYSLNIKELKVLISSKIHEERMIALFIMINKYKTTNHEKIIFNFYLKNMKYINNWDLVDLSAPNIVGAHLYENEFFARQSRISDNSQFARGPVTRFPPASAPLTVRAVGSLSSRATPRSVLMTLVKSKNLWERRIAVLATFYFIKNNKFEESLKLAEILLQDKHDLIQKAVGWMLREIGKKDPDTEIKFLNINYKKMPRTMLRYAIERFPEKLRLSFLKK